MSGDITPTERVGAGDGRSGHTQAKEHAMTNVTLGIDVACRAPNRATLADETGTYLWSGRAFRATPDELEQLWAQVPQDAAVTVVMEPTRNAWAPLAAWLHGRGAKIVVVPPEQSADLRDYYAKHTKNDRLDSRVLARLPLLHPEGLTEIDGFGPADPLKRAVRRRSKLVERRTACFHRIDCLVELLGPVWADVLGTGQHTKTALAVLERYANPHKLLRLGEKRLTGYLARHSRGHWKADKAAALRDAATQSIALWPDETIDFDELADDIASEIRTVRAIDVEIAQLEDRIARMYAEADPAGIILSGPGIGPALAASILGAMGDPNRFANLRAVRSFTGLVPGVDQSGDAERHTGPTKAGDPRLREALYLAAEHARLIDPTLAAKYHRLVAERGKHHVSAICHLAPQLGVRLAACWRNGERYIIRDTHGRAISEAQGRNLVDEHWKVTEEVRRASRRGRKSQGYKQRARTDQRDQKSTNAAPDTGPPATRHDTRTREEAA
jgi:transposase